MVKAGAKSKYLHICIISCILFVLLYSSIWAKFDKVTVQGKAAILGNNILDAKDRAKNDALRNAVEQVAGILAASKSKFLNSVLLKDLILTRTMGYIRNYEIVTEWEEDGIYVVEIEAIVSDGTLWNDILAKKLLLAEAHYPRVLFLVDERIPENRRSYPNWSRMSECEVSLIQKFKNAGFKVKDPEVLRRNIDRAKALKIIKGDKQAVKALKSQYGVELLIVGDANGRDLGDQIAPPLHTCNAYTNLRVIKTDNAEILTASSREARIADIDPASGMNKALSKACTELAEELLLEIFRNYRDEVLDRRIIELVLTGVRAYGEIDRFKKVLQEKIRGIKGVHQREFTLNTAIFDIEYTEGDGVSLGSQIQATKFEYFKVFVTGNSHSRVEAEIFRHTQD